VESRFPKKTKTVDHIHIQVIADMGKSRAEAKAQAAQRKEDAISAKMSFIQWKKDEAALDQEQAALNCAQKDEMMAICRMEAENRKLELELKLSKRKHDKSETESDDE
jgi:hypothetical protein